MSFSIASGTGDQRWLRLPEDAIPDDMMADGYALIRISGTWTWLILCQRVEYHGQPLDRFLDVPVKCGIFWEPVKVADLSVADLP